MHTALSDVCIIIYKKVSHALILLDFLGSLLNIVSRYIS